MASDFSGKFFSAISCNFRSANADLRTALALSREAVEAAYEKGANCGAEEFLILSTCNRVEVYTVENRSESVSAGALAARILEKLRGVSAGEILAGAETFSGAGAARHLFEVASGMDSQMVGEVEILGQLKQAYEIASRAGATGALLNRVFQKSFQAAKWVRSNTAISQGQVSVGNVSVDLAGRIFGELARCAVFVLGVGEAGRKVAKAFCDRGAGRITVASRTYEKARALAEEIGASVAELSSLATQVARADVVVGCASVEEPLLRAGEIAAIMRSRAGMPLFFIDLGIPKNFDSVAREIDDVWLYDLADLSAVTNENLAARRREIARSRVEILRRVALLGLD